MNTWWVNLGEELRRKWWRSWENGKQIAELRLLKLWIRQSDPIANEVFSEDQMVRLRVRIMMKINEPEILSSSPNIL